VRLHHGEIIGTAKGVANPAEPLPVCDVATGLLTKAGDEKSYNLLGPR
jgi:hypothetical protein